MRKRKVKNSNPIAKSLRNPLLRIRKIRSKKLYSRKRVKDQTQ